MVFIIIMDRIFIKFDNILRISIMKYSKKATPRKQSFGHKQTRKLRLPAAR